MAAWQRIEKYPRGSGNVLLRAGPGFLDGVYVGRQDPDNGRWYDDHNAEVEPEYFALIPPFDLDESAA